MTLVTSITSRFPFLKIAVMLTALSIVILPGCVQPSEKTVTPYGPGLAMQMHNLQTWTHKLALSIEAENDQLVDFYHHEIEEAIDDIIQTTPEYDGFPIAMLTETMLTPSMEALEAALDSADWGLIRTRFEQVIISCNQCHMATDHGFIVITPGFGQNPFNQVFQIK